MKFSKNIGNVDKDLVARAEKHLSEVFTDIGSLADNKYKGTRMAGDPLLFSLVVPMEHVVTNEFKTAATNGKCYFWNAEFLLSKSKTGVRLICAHEAWHAIYLHPSRTGRRNRRLWNFAVDYIVNFNIAQDIKARGLDNKQTILEHLGNYIPLEEYANALRDPNKEVTLGDGTKYRFIPSEKDYNSGESYKGSIFFMDLDLPENMRKPEKIYEYLLSLMPKCDECGKLGVYKKPDYMKSPPDPNKKSDGKKDKKSKSKKDKSDKGDKSDKHEHGDDHQHGDSGEPCCDHGGQPAPGEGDQPGEGDGQGDAQGQGQGPSCGHDGKGCGTCGGDGDGFDVFGIGDTLDEHVDTEESEEKLAKRMKEAIESAKKMAGTIPGGLEEELGILEQAKIVWQDKIRARLHRAHSGNTRNDWTKIRSRPMFAGLMVPKRISHVANFVCLLDTSGSMSDDDISFGVSQLQALDNKAEGWIIPADTEIHYDKMTRVKKCDASNLQRTRVVGRGGTSWSHVLEGYEQHCGKADFVIFITDGYLSDYEMMNMTNPTGVEVYWLITSNYDNFQPKFGKVYNLR
jgi:predicted metal-dependent peptidase